jgi:hypothetical protein
MGEIVNLRKARKLAKKRDDAQLAASNRIVHGRSKSERELDKKNNEKLNKLLDRHKIDTGDTG